ncbi:MAG: HAMP domain-containing histidine kinase [Oscillospiraceae bacterium]|nr:HAMP domain-containing histidine kinase [Oscillospiraceae bacterium]
MKKQRKYRVGLTLLFSALVGSFVLVTLLLVLATAALLLHFEVLTGPDDTQISSLQLLLLFGLSTFVVGFLITLVLGRIPMKPVNRLINQMNRLADGDYHARIHYPPGPGHHPAVVEISESFNRMAQELQSTEMLRNDFINNFSHEFKTPIVSIAGFAKLLRKGHLTAEQQEEYLRIIEEESLRLSRMATNVLSLTKVENQTILTDTSVFNLSEQIRSCILLLSEKWERKQLELVVDFDEYEICANESLLQEVWLNLLDNAIKFTPRCGTVEVNIARREKVLAVTVKNEGNEIPEEQQGKIFRKFYQADESHAAEGNGVGLAIVRRVVELHEGSVTVKSENGSTEFTVLLPPR